MLPLKHLIDTYGSKIKYILFGILIFAMLVAIRTYINYITIIDTTTTVRNRSAFIQNEADYAKNFQMKYLSSEYGHLFLAHDNNVLFWGESIISFKSWTEEEEIATNISLSHIPDHKEAEEQEKMTLTPQEARKKFIREKLETNN